MRTRRGGQTDNIKVNALYNSRVSIWMKGKVTTVFDEADEPYDMIVGRDVIHDGRLAERTPLRRLDNRTNQS